VPTVKQFFLKRSGTDAQEVPQSTVWTQSRLRKHLPALYDADPPQISPADFREAVRKLKDFASVLERDAFAPYKVLALDQQARSFCWEATCYFPYLGLDRDIEAVVSRLHRADLLGFPKFDKGAFIDINDQLYGEISCLALAGKFDTLLKTFGNPGRVSLEVIGKLRPEASESGVEEKFKVCIVGALDGIIDVWPCGYVDHAGKE
jgi:hypothetical protein